jgi:hypothetical protein
MQNSKTTLEIMLAAAETYKERNKQYGDSYLRHAAIMKALFPKGLELNTNEDFNRFGVMNMIVSKLVRYTQNWYQPHIDSIHDMGVYCFIGQELDEKLLAKEKEEVAPPPPNFVKVVLAENSPIDLLMEGKQYAAK